MKISQERLYLLNTGQAETKNLMECLSIDFKELLQGTFPGLVIPSDLLDLKITKKMLAIAQFLIDHIGHQNAHAMLSAHPSDTLRGLACFVVGLKPNQSLEYKLNIIRALADDHHFGVREWAWMALRDDIATTPQHALDLLGAWAEATSPFLRRFASESTRPRGVWCKHIGLLRQEPWLALSLLNVLKNDSERYVQLSVGNWLNDAAKDHPGWVWGLTEEWLAQSPTPATSHICKRARRSIKK